MNSKTNGNGTGAAARLRAHVETLEAVVVDVKAPSGFVYKIAKPSKFGLLFEMVELPQEAASTAVQKWIDDGIVTQSEDGTVDDSIKIIDKVLTLLERTAYFSRSPKIILSGTPANDNEVLASELPETDLEYLLQWVKAGGEVAAMLVMFPGGSRQGSVVGSNRKGFRSKAK